MLGITDMVRVRMKPYAVGLRGRAHRGVLDDGLGRPLGNHGARRGQLVDAHGAVDAGRLLAADRLLEAAQARAERAAHLGQPLGAENEQQQDEDEGEVNWVIESHHWCAPIDWGWLTSFYEPGPDSDHWVRST